MDYRRTKDEYYEAVKEKLLDVKFLSNYESQKIPLLVENKYGVCSILANNILSGSTPSIQNALNKTEYFINQYKDYFKNELDFSKFIYVSAKTKGIVIDRFGECLVEPRHLNLGSLPNIQSAINKNQYFTNMCIEKWGYFFDYKDVEFIDMHSKIVIKCPIHGNFQITPANHLCSVTGCGQCGNEKVFEINRQNPIGWGFKIWEEMGNNSKEFDSFKLYIISCEKEGEKFYKIGKTYKTLHKRFIPSRFPYNYTLLFTHIDSAENISYLEKHLQKINKNNKYIPNNHFDGKYECYKNLNEETWKYIKNLNTLMEVSTLK